METMLKVVVQRWLGSERDQERRSRKRIARDLTLSSLRHLSMPSYPAWLSRSEIDVSEIRKASFQVTGMECAAMAASPVSPVSSSLWLKHYRRP